MTQQLICPRGAPGRAYKKITTSTSTERPHSSMSTQQLAVDPAFVGVGEEPGLTLWRIEQTVVVKQPAVSRWFVADWNQEPRETFFRERVMAHEPDPFIPVRKFVKFARVFSIQTVLNKDSQYK